MILTDPNQVRAGSGDSLVERCVREVLTIIREEKLRPGESLPSEGALAMKLGVSRVVVREANRSLDALGVIEIGSGRPARVAVPDSGVFGILIGHAVQTQFLTIAQVLDVRRCLERRAAILAALRRTDEEAHEIMRLAQAMLDDIDDPDRLMRHDLDLHRLIISASRNPLFNMLCGAFEAVIISTWPLGWRARGSNEGRMPSIHAHMDVAQAIMNHDTAGVDAAMSRHFDETMRVLVDAGIA